MGLFSSFKQTDPSRAATVPSPAAERLRRADLTAQPAGAGWFAVRLRGEGSAELWPDFVFDFLAECHEFRPLAEHLAEYVEYHGLETAQTRELAMWGARLREAGLLISTGELRRRCGKADATAEPGEGALLGMICIPTAGHLERVRRVVESFARNAREHGRQVRFAIAANCGGEQMAAVAALARELESGSGMRTAAFGEAENQRYARELAAAAGVDPEVALFAVGDPHRTAFACGANRNALLLRHAGHSYLSVDDDVVCAVMTADELEPKEGVLVFSASDAMQRCFYSTQEEALAQGREVPGDLLALHEGVLGRGVGAILREEKGEVVFSGVTDEMLRRLVETEGRVVASFSGYRGHPGIPTSYYYLTYNTETLARLTGRGEERYREWLRSGAVCSLVPRRAIADASLSPGMVIGIDGRELLPPFPPVLHAEDFVWGAAVWQCCAHGFAAHLPVAVRHDPGPGRGLLAPNAAVERPVAIWEFAHILRGLVLQWHPPLGCSSTEVRMRRLGAHLCELADAEGGEFAEHLREFVLRHEGEKIAYLERRLREEEGAAEFWRRDVEQYIEQTRRAVSLGDFVIPYDLRAKWSPGEALPLMQRLVFDYGRLLQAWPALVRAARERGERG